MSYQDFTELPVWQLAFNLLKPIYSITKTFPADERYGPVSDMRRAANSITHNLRKDSDGLKPGINHGFINSPGAVFTN